MNGSNLKLLPLSLLIHTLLMVLPPASVLAKTDTTRAHDLWAEAENHYTLFKHKEAGEAYRQAETEFLKARCWERAAHCLQNVALSSRNVRKTALISEAIDAYKTALKNQWTPEYESNVQMAMIEYYLAKRNLDSAEIHARKARELRIATFGELHQKTGAVYTSLGIILAYKNDAKGALQEFQMALKSAEKNYSYPHERIQRAINNMGNAWSSLEDYKKAKVYYHQSLNLAILLYGPNSLKLETSYNNLSHVSNMIRDYDSCIYFREKLRTLFTQNLGANHLETLMNESRIADEYILKGQYDEAIVMFDRLVEILRPLSKEEYGNMEYQYGQLADCYLAKEEYDKAELYYRRALSESMDNHGPKATINGVFYYGTAQCQNARDEHRSALGNFKKALEVQLPELGPDNGNIAMIYDQIAGTHTSLHQDDSALKYHEMALRIYGITTDLDYMDSHARVLVDLGEIYDHRKEYTKAIELKKRGIDLIRKSFTGKHHYKAYPYSSLSKTYGLMNKPDLALSYLWRAMNENQINGFDTLAGTTALKASGCLDHDIYSSQLLKAGRLLTRIAKPDLRKAFAYMLVADTVLLRNQKNRALESDQIKVGEDIRAVSGQALFLLHTLQKSNPTQVINGLSLKEWTFYFASRRQASTLAQSLAANKAKKISGLPAELLAKESSLKLQIKNLEKGLQELTTPETRFDSTKKEVLSLKLFELQREKDKLAQHLEKDYPRYRMLKNVSSFPSQVDVQSILTSTPKKTALVSMVWDDRHPFLYVISAGKEQLLSLPFDSLADKKIAAFRKAIRLGFSSVTDELSYGFYSKYFKTLHQWLANEQIEKVVMVTEGIWSAFPFEGLVFATGKSKKYWVETYEMAYTQSIPLWITNQKEGSKAVVKDSKSLKCIAFAPVFADRETNFLNKSCERFVQQYTQSRDSSDYGKRQKGQLVSNTRAFDKDGQYINPLPYTENEVVQISGLFSKDKNLFFKYFVRKDAVESRFKSKEVAEADILHLATHGIVNEDKPELSGLLFHPTPVDSAEDGILYTGEIYNLSLKADLVTLSACETGLGKVQKGEGMLGLTRSFTYAGAKNLLVSLWKVSDKATSDLMIEFYNQLLSGKSKSESLRRAKQKLLKNPDTANPYYWAAFVLVEG